MWGDEKRAEMNNTCCLLQKLSLKNTFNSSLTTPLYLDLKPIADLSKFDFLSKLYKLSLFKENNILCSGKVVVEIIIYSFNNYIHVK